MLGAHKRTPPVFGVAVAATVFTVADLADVVYSAGAVFDGLRASRLDTENFLSSGSLEGISSKSDRALLQGLRDLAQFIIGNRQPPVDSVYVRAVNEQITRSGPLHPGQHRAAARQIGVSTHYGRHEPPATNDRALQRIIDRAMAEVGPREQALELFVQIAKAQPFEDGNKRTALFLANSVLIRESKPEMLVVPADENNPSKATRFNDLLARAYVLGENEGVKDLLRVEGFRTHAGARTRTAVRQQSAAVERIISRSFDPEQIDPPTTQPDATTRLPESGDSSPEDRPAPR